ncbi:transposase [Brevibacillus laterosporus]|uniref:Transposase n=1 Tax=Brevibacillus laterosporus TaxID=1465 RepID=A0A518VBJ0_BRELA|nr:transposase [Brevibacillus laterosporus]
MSNYNRKRQLQLLHDQRKAKTLVKVYEAIKRLLKAYKSINFNSVASESGVSKATLYNNPELRQRIESLRLQQAQIPTPKQLKLEMNENNKDAMIASLKRRLKKMEDENKQLREQLKIAYAEVYRNL